MGAQHYCGLRGSAFGEWGRACTIPGGEQLLSARLNLAEPNRIQVAEARRCVV